MVSTNDGFPTFIRGYKHIQFDPKVGHEICKIRHITCDKCTSIPNKTWVHCLTPQQKLRCQPVIDWTYWPLLGSFNNWNIITLSHKATTSDVFEEINQVLLDVVIYMMASLVQSSKYIAINKTDTLTMVYYVIQFVSEAYTLQDETTCDRNNISNG